MTTPGQHKPAKHFIAISLTLFILCASTALWAQGVTTAGINGLVTSSDGEGLVGANVVALHRPTGTLYGTAVRTGGVFTIANMKVGGPYTVVVSFIGYKPNKADNLYLYLGQNLRLDFQLVEKAVDLDAIEVVAERDNVLNANRTGAATFITTDQVKELPSIERSTRDLIRLDPRNDGNYSFAGRNWLFNNISLDGSYFNNPFGLDDPAPGGQTNAEPVPFDAIEQVQVSVAPFDVRQSGFTGANINTVTKSGTNQYRGSLYSYFRNDGLLGNDVRGREVIARPDLSFNQSGFTFSGPLVRNKVFFFINGELERTDLPGSNFVANRSGGVGFGESRARADTLSLIRQRMIDVYDYDPGAFEGFVHETNNNKLLLKLDWNLNSRNNLTFRYNLLDAKRELPPHPFVLSAFRSGRGPNEQSLPFQKSGYEINNDLHSFAVELNSRGSRFANRFFFSYNRFRDFRDPFSQPFPTIEIAENGRTYTTLGHEPFSIHNILDQDVFQFTNNLSLFRGKHAITLGANFEIFSFFNSFNLFRFGLFHLNDEIGGTTFDSLAEFFARTNPGPDGLPNTADDPADFFDFNSLVTPANQPFKGEDIRVGQLSIYAQDEVLASEKFNLTYGLRIDFPMYFTDAVDNPFSRELELLDDEDLTENVDQSDLPGAQPLFSPRIGFNWNVTGDRSTQLRGGTGIFTGRVPFVWIGNVISNPGDNPNLYDPAEDPDLVPGATGLRFADVPESHRNSDDSVLQQSFDLNAMVDNFKWPQVWTTNLAVDQKLPWNMLGTFELLFGKDINAVYVRNADLERPDRLLRDGRPFFGGTDPLGGPNSYELNQDGGKSVYVLDNTSSGWNFNLTTQLRKTFDFGMFTSLSYSFTDARSELKTTEIASVLFQENPVQGDPNRPELSYSEFGQRHRIVGGANYRHEWSKNAATSFGLFLEIAEGNPFLNGGNRFSVIYSGDVNGDGSDGNDLIYIPRNSGEIIFSETDARGNFFETPAQQWNDFNAFISQDSYLDSHRGQIADRFGIINPWYSNIDLRLLQDLSLTLAGQRHAFQLSFDILNVANLLSSDWGVRKTADPAATRPLQLVRFNAQGEPEFNFVGPRNTFVDDLSQLSRWRIQIGLRYMFN
jgi:hypothetical protein